MVEMNKTASTSDLPLRVQFFLALRARDAVQVRQLAQAHRELLEAYTEWAELENSNYWPLGYTALHYAAGVGDMPLADGLIAVGADVNAMTKHRFATPLHVAVMQRRSDMIARLLKAGANVGAVNYNGQTALHFAAYRGHAEIIGALLKAGAAVSLKDAGGRTPLDWALHRGQDAAAEMLRKAGGETMAPPAPVVPPPDKSSAIFETGIKIVDLFAPLARGRVNALFTPLSGVGKVASLEQLIETTARRYGGHTIFMGIETARYSGADFGTELEDIGLQDAASLCFAQGDNAQAMPKVVDAALGMVDRAREMLVLADAAYAEVPGLQAKIEAAAGTSKAGGSVTVLWYGNYTAGAEPDNFANVQSLITFDMWRALNGYWSAIDPLRSQSRLIEGRQAALVARAKRLLRRYEDLRVIVERDPRGLEGLDTDADRTTVARARRLHAFLSQPIPIAELFTNTYGEHVPLAWALDGLEAVLDGKADAVNEAELRVIAGTRLYVRR